MRGNRLLLPAIAKSEGTDVVLRRKLADGHPLKQSGLPFKAWRCSKALLNHSNAFNRTACPTAIGG